MSYLKSLINQMLYYFYGIVCWLILPFIFCKTHKYVLRFPLELRWLRSCWRCSTSVTTSPISSLFYKSFRQSRFAHSLSFWKHRIRSISVIRFPFGTTISGGRRTLCLIDVLSLCVVFSCATSGSARRIYASFSQILSGYFYVIHKWLCSKQIKKNLTY